MRIFSVYYDAPFIQGTVLEKGRKGLQILDQKISTDPENVKQLYLLGHGLVTCGLSAKDLLIRTLDLKKVANRYVEEAADFQSEAACHLNPAEILTSHQFQKKTDGTIQSIAFTTPREAIQELLDTLKTLRLDPDRIGTVPSALVAFVKWKFPELQDALVIDLGSKEWTLAWMAQRRLKKAHSIIGGLEDLFTALLEDRKRTLLKKEVEGTAKQLDLLLLKPGLNSHLTDKLNEKHQEVSRVLYSFLKGENIPVLFTGLTNAFIHFPEFLVEGWKNEYSLSSEEQRFAISTGLCIEQADPNALNFRKGEFFPKKNWKKLGINGIALLGASLVLSALLCFASFYLNQVRMQQMMRNIPASLSMDQWISQMEANNKEYPYLIKAPKVSEVLAWISEHPLFQEIELRDLRYQLVSLPRLNSLKEPYLAKVEVEFQCTNAIARKMHDALIAGDDLVDPHRNITWEASQSGYRTIFFLRNHDI